MEYEQIRFAVEDQVATITLHRPERLNAFTWRMGAEWGDALARADADEEIRAVVITGAGRAFCAGADLGRGDDTFKAPSEELARDRRPLQPWEVRKPVIAAINGHAIGVGITFPMQCDVRIVAKDAKLQFAFVRRGVIPELGSHVTLARVVGLSKAAELLLSGRIVTGSEAATLGLASTALPASQVLPAAHALARDIAANCAPASVALSKQLLWRGLGCSPEEMMRLETERFTWTAERPDAAEGVRAFTEKRAPRWNLCLSDIPAWSE
jgi:enoyl-CoA hydratase/carnithine racemase